MTQMASPESVHLPAAHWITRSRTLGWIALVASYPLSNLLPAMVGYENGPAEDAQAVLLAMGAFVAAWMAWRRRHTPEVHFWLAMLPFWMVCFGRELAWGAAFLPPQGMTDEGPVVSSRGLPYHGAIGPIIALLAIFAGWQFFRYRMHRVVLARLWHEGRLPWSELILFIVAMVVATCAEGHGFVTVPLPEPRAQIFEEIAEFVGYFGLFLAQARVINALHAKRSAHETSSRQA